MKAKNGFSLIEVSIALALIGITCIGLVASMGTASKTLGSMDRQEAAKELAAAQLEYIQNQPYDSAHNPPVYQVLPNLDTRYPGFSIATPMASRLDPVGDHSGKDEGLQHVSVVVNKDGKTAFTLEGEKVQW